MAGRPAEGEGVDRMLLRDGLVVDSTVVFDIAGLRAAVTDGPAE